MDWTNAGGVLNVCCYQILQLLQSALTSNSCLNDVFGLQKPRFDFMQLVRLGLFEAATKPKWIPE
jgi:hypothetical protein